MSIKINKDESKRVHVWIRSAIGTPNRRQYKHKNIMYPYFRMYKSPYRARDSRTRQAFWPCVDKYPWHTHQKRWVKPEELNVKFFSEFVNKPPDKKNLFETCHTLPFNGVNCLFWNPVYLNSHKYFAKRSKVKKQADTAEEDTADEEKQAVDGGEHPGEGPPPMGGHANQKVIRINNFHYIVHSQAKNGLYFYLKCIRYSMRPFRGKIIGDLYMNERKIRSNISTNGIINGEWKYSFPHVKISEKFSDAALDDPVAGEESGGGVLAQLVIADKYTYRPPLPGCFSGP
ncbi:unnamed protein product [Plasmodium vivax]|uniref:Uncharacterized protein n=4 Tax=Plasmodium vivax TaxID=5855 RepID=A5K3F3_PLAVS|nr:hypothetical protein, conserved [Plasmodium vivax]KMZ85141.1 hypothetical protein PVBG_01540 [Plasmodium vivax Brazil I]KMZ91601.1 hypothetical protein PVMG_00474 [Plasmodium vivax Mauritania I]EDL46057.1 hypothetical protein, conserved [Plasmodium vivax]CAG9473695.1 unnamed protein product [Plasmodium vivax]CAI7722281.1 conserved protein, unknown function [Plasmodium vivax]|eukprot:XP_001615784.1 hypothetical protein [Plasmodium vivax Sal-1]